jgi:hypothetical protein
VTQALVNIIILSPDQEGIIKKIQKAETISKVLNLLISLTPSILQFKKNDFKAKRNLRHFVSFVTHTFRFLIVCQSVDHKCLSADATLSMTLS